MLYKVFLDTNIYDGANYSFHNALFSALRNKAASDEVELHINSVVEGEVEAHISRDVKRAAKELSQAISQRSLAGFRKLSSFQDKLSIPKPNEWVQTALDEFQHFLSDCAVKRITVNGIDVEKIVKDYFDQNLPFEEKKPDEFKDAIAVASIVQEIGVMGEDELYCVVSSDNGFRNAVEQYSASEKVKTFDSLHGLTDYFARQDQRAQRLKEYMDSENAHDLLVTTITEAIEAATLDVERIEYFTEDLEIMDIDDVQYKTYIISIYTEENVAKVSIEAKCKVRVYYKYTDEDESYYDKEDHAYLWQKIVELEDTYEVELGLTASFDISKCNDGIDDADECIEFLEYLDAPERIDFEEDMLIESEELSNTGSFHDEYDPDEERMIREHADTTCPDCGCPIGIGNDGGNGFCINCADRH